MTLRNWLDIVAEYTTAEDAVMRDLKQAGSRQELETIHLLKGLCGARIVEAA